MKPSEIQVGKTYVNRGAGRTRRTVIAIGPEHAPTAWWGDPDKRPAAAEPGVVFTQMGGESRALYLSSFAAWAGKEAP